MQRSALLLTAAGITLLLNCRLLMAEFSTVIDVPPAPDIENSHEIYSGTQLNLLPGGYVGSSFHAWSGSEVNISGGEIGSHFTVGQGATANISGGITGSIVARDDSTVAVSGGEIGSRFTVEQGATANISGGITGGIVARDGSTVAVSGGAIGDTLRAFSNSSVALLGDEFMIDGTPVDGLAENGDTISVEVPFDSLLTGVFADGTPFVFGDTKGFSLGIENFNTFSLVKSQLPDSGSSWIDVGGSAVPLGARNGQVVLVRNGAQLGKNFTATQGSVVWLQEGGSAQDNLEVAGSTVNLAGGTIIHNFDALEGSTVNVTAGFAYEVVLLDSDLNITGGIIGREFTISIDSSIYAKRNASIYVRGGVVGNGIHIGEGSVLNVTGGRLGDYIDIWSGAIANIAGGAFGERFKASQGSETNVFGTEFFLDGQPIIDLSYYLRTPLLARDQRLSGTLADGTSFDFLLSTDRLALDDWFSPDALVTLTLVPDSADYNDDSNLDGTDFLEWQRGNSPHPLTFSDLVAWQANHGGSNRSIVSKVPESCCLTQMAFVLLLYLGAMPREVGM